MEEFNVSAIFHTRRQIAENFLNIENSVVFQNFMS